MKTGESISSSPFKNGRHSNEINLTYFTSNVSPAKKDRCGNKLSDDMQIFTVLLPWAVPNTSL